MPQEGISLPILGLFSSAASFQTLWISELVARPPEQENPKDQCQNEGKRTDCDGAATVSFRFSPLDWPFHPTSIEPMELIEPVGEEIQIIGKSKRPFGRAIRWE
jgi:hypothetical protein